LGEVNASLNLTTAGDAAFLWRVRFELTEQTLRAVEDYLRTIGKRPGKFLFFWPSQFKTVTFRP
jgi:hypothetical protein